MFGFHWSQTWTTYRIGVGCCKTDVLVPQKKLKPFFRVNALKIGQHAGTGMLIALKLTS